jgi:hypothetical protein
MGVAEVIALLQWFNEAVMRPTAVVLDIAVRSVRALYFGFRAGAVEAGADVSLAFIISGFIVIGLLLGLLRISALAARKFRMKNPGPNTIFAGSVLFWLGCAVGIYFLGVTFYALAQPNLPLEIVGYLVGTAALYPAVGRVIRYVLGR